MTGNRPSGIEETKADGAIHPDTGNLCYFCTFLRLLLRFREEFFLQSGEKDVV